MQGACGPCLSQAHVLFRLCGSSDMYLKAFGWGACPSICCDPYPFVHSHDLLGPCRHLGCSLWQIIAKAVRSHTLPKCSTGLTSPGSSSFMPSRQKRKLLLSPESSLFPWVIAEWEQERERERERICRHPPRPQIPSVASSLTSPLQSFCCSSLGPHC